MEVVGSKNDGIDAFFVGLEELFDEAAQNVHGRVLIPPAKVCESKRSAAALECLPEVVDDIGPVTVQGSRARSVKRSRTYASIVFPVPAEIPLINELLQIKIYILHLRGPVPHITW